MTATVGNVGGRSPFWIAFALLVGLSWAVLLGMALSLEGPLLWTGDVGRWFAEICRAGAARQAYGPVLAMWALMTVAMMGPTAIPFLQTYATMGRGGGRKPRLRALLALLAGFLSVWMAYAFVAAALQLALRREGFVSDLGRSQSIWLIAVFLTLAGGYQLSRWKAACLARCRDPFRFFLHNWCDGTSGALWMGALQGLVCVACCWALMLLTFVGGVMNVLWMAAATIAMVAEKHPAAAAGFTSLSRGRS